MTSSAERKKVLVIGATGNQGCGLITHLLTTKEWYPVALTRNPDSPSARSLANRGVEIMKGDMDDLDSLRVSIRGSHGVFSVKNENTIETEFNKAKNNLMADINTFITLPTQTDKNRPHINNLQSDIQSCTFLLKIPRLFK